MIVGLILEEKQPFLGALRRVHLDLHGTGVDFLRLIKVGKSALFTQVLPSDGSKVHECDGLGPPQVISHRQVVFVGLLNDGIFKLDVVDLGEECRVPTVVRPVGIDDAQLSDGGIAQLTLEMLLADKEVIKVHGEPVCALQLDESVLVEVAEPADGGNRLGGAGGFL